jgi:hypothetical protein
MCVFKYHAFIYFLRPPPWYGTKVFKMKHIEIWNYSGFRFLNFINSVLNYPYLVFCLASSGKSLIQLALFSVLRGQTFAKIHSSKNCKGIPASLKTEMRRGNVYKNGVPGNFQGHLSPSFSGNCVQLIRTVNCTNIPWQIVAKNVHEILLWVKLKKMINSKTPLHNITQNKITKL